MNTRDALRAICLCATFMFGPVDGGFAQSKAQATLDSVPRHASESANEGRGGPERPRIPVVIAIVDTTFPGDVPAVLLHRANVTPTDVILMRSGPETPDLLSEMLHGVRGARQFLGAEPERTYIIRPKFEKRPRRMKRSKEVLRRLRATAPTDLESIGRVRNITVYIDDMGRAKQKRK